MPRPSSPPPRSPSARRAPADARLLGGAAGAIILLTASAARAQSLLDPRSFGVAPGRGGVWLAIVLGVGGLGCTVALGQVRRYHSATWLRPWFLLAAAAAPLLLAGLPLLVGAFASRYQSGDYRADVAMLAATRFISLAAAAVWLAFEFMAAERQHEQELYVLQHASDKWSLLMRRMAAVMGAIGLFALVQGLSVAVVVTK